MVEGRSPDCGQGRAVPLGRFGAEDPDATRTPLGEEAAHPFHLQARSEKAARSAGSIRSRPRSPYRAAGKRPDWTSLLTVEWLTPSRRAACATLRWSVGVTVEIVIYLVVSAWRSFSSSGPSRAFLRPPDRGRSKSPKSRICPTDRPGRSRSGPPLVRRAFVRRRVRLPVGESEEEDELVRRGLLQQDVEPLGSRPHGPLAGGLLLLGHGESVARGPLEPMGLVRARKSRGKFVLDFVLTSLPLSAPQRTHPSQTMRLAASATPDLQTFKTGEAA